VTPEQYTRERAEVLQGADPSAELLADCRRTARLMIRTSGLPGHYSPLGVWSEEAVEEAFADFTAERLVARGQLVAMLQRAPVQPVFRRMLETALRQHLIDRLQRSQSANLYARVNQLLADSGRYESSGSGAGRLWRLPGGTAAPFTGDDRALGALAWSLGEFKIIRYKLDAKKLSPLLDRDELTRFLDGLLDAGAMDIATICRALKLRFALDDPAQTEPLEPDMHAEGTGADPQQTVLQREIATAALAELTERQLQVLIGAGRGESTRELALRLGCSTGTVSHERGQIGAVLALLAGDDPAVLKEMLDALLIGKE
jgi:DNA-binding CsgD family transcriptional regulator